MIKYGVYFFLLAVFSLPLLSDERPETREESRTVITSASSLDSTSPAPINRQPNTRSTAPTSPSRETRIPDQASETSQREQAPRPDTEQREAQAEAERESQKTAETQTRQTSVSSDRAPASFPEPPDKELPNKEPPDKEPAKSIKNAGSLLNSTLPINYGSASGKLKRKPLHQLVITANNLREAEKQRKSLSQHDFSIVSRKNLSHLGMFASTFQVPDRLTLEDAQTFAVSLFPNAGIEPNSRFDLLGTDIKRYGQSMMNLSPASPCQQTAHIAILDSLVNPSVIKTNAERIQVFDATDKQILSDKHGTAIANLLVSNDEKYPGVVPNAHLYAINVFFKEDDQPIETRLDWLLYGFNTLAGLTPKPSVVNLSFGGQYSPMLERVIAKISQSMPLVAAAGNSGSDELIYPAAFETVIAVGSINAKGKRTKDSNYGDHVKVFAPGEDIWTLNHNGEGFFARGTSYSAPFAAAAIALADNKKSSLDTYLNSLGPSNTIDFSSLCN